MGGQVVSLCMPMNVEFSTVALKLGSDARR